MREKKLLINSFLYFWGSLGKGVASIVVVFMASFYVSPSDMGIYDLVISTITLLQPIIIFQINDGIYRWLLERPDDKENIIKSGFKIAFRNILIADAIIILVLVKLNLQYHKIFAISGIINGVLVLFISFILMKYFGQGVKGFYIAQIIANVCGIAYMDIAQKVSLKPWGGDIEKIKKYSVPMQKYSIMLVPNSVNQWVMKALDKYCILFFLSTFENGIYTVAHRFPDILIMINNMFYSAWVEQSIVEYSSDDRDEYFSKVYGIYTNVIISIVLMAIPITKYFIYYFVGTQYQEAYLYVPTLYIGVIFLGLSSFIGTGYLGSKQTEGILWTSLAGSITNTLINIILMPFFRLQIAGISSVCAYFMMWIIRIWQTKKFFKLSIKWESFIPLILTTILFAFLVQLNKFWLDIIMEIFSIILALILNNRFLLAIINAIFNRLRK